MTIQSTTIAAWYGAGLSTLGFALSLYVAVRDKPRLKISIQANMRIWDARTWTEPPFQSDKQLVSVTVANVGRGTVTVSKVWFTQRRGGAPLLVSDGLVGPREISEGKSLTFSVDQENFPFATVAHVFVCDLADRKWRKRIPRSIRRTPTSPGVPDQSGA